MAVMRQSIIYGGINSADYGIYIGGEGTFNAPKKIVEMVSVPGRNGDIAIDQGSYENIEVSYTAIIYEPDLESFADNLRDFRNALVSQKGYQRLTDTIHPEEYRLAMFIDGFELTPVMYNTAAEFDIVFNCKPQRFLMDGESAMTVADGQSVFNPTPFDSQPLLEIEGYGTIEFNGFEVDIENNPLGEVELIGRQYFAPIGSTNPYIRTLSFDKNLVRTGDTITISELSSGRYISTDLNASFAFDPTNYVPAPGTTYTNTHIAYALCTFNVSQGLLQLRLQLDGATFVVGTASTFTASSVITIPISASGGASTGQSAQITVSVLVAYDGDCTFTYTLTRTVDSDPLSIFTGGTDSSKNYLYPKETKADSTVSQLGHPTYIDCELGEAYMIKDGSYISLNEYIDLGSDLPTLAPGNNEFTFDDSTMTEVKIVPRWWIL